MFDIVWCLYTEYIITYIDTDIVATSTTCVYRFSWVLQFLLKFELLRVGQLFFLIFPGIQCEDNTWPTSAHSLQILRFLTESRSWEPNSILAGAYRMLATALYRHIESNNLLPLMQCCTFKHSNVHCGQSFHQVHFKIHTTKIKNVKPSAECKSCIV